MYGQIKLVLKKLGLFILTFNLLLFVLDMCVYKSTIYSQDDIWDDGCDLSCECVDQMRGQYKCTER